MDASLKLRDLLGKAATAELWTELAKRLGVRFGKIQMAVHDWKPSKYATVDMKVSMEENAGDRITEIDTK